MTILVIGPTGSGKSTYIRSAFPDHDQVVFAFELEDRDVPEDGILHLNMLFGANRMPDQVQDWDLFAEPVVRKIKDSCRIQRAVVIVAPIQELIHRARRRGLVEPLFNREDVYEQYLWCGLLSSVDHFALYERVFEWLAHHGISTEVVYSSSDFGKLGTPTFLPSDRVFAHLNLRGTYVSVPPREEILAIINDPGCVYQNVMLPRGTTTQAGAYTHVSEGRKGTFEAMTHKSFRGRSVLDVGCALGDLLFRAERHGAGRLLGIELKPERWRAATKLATLLHSRAQFFLGGFMSFNFSESFDDVLLLNVLHHVPDFHGVLSRAVSISNERIILEYPTLDDPKFCGITGAVGNLGHLPVIGVSSKQVDQTFVYSRAALERIIEDLGSFTFECLHSPIVGREILICSRNQ